MTDFVDKTHSSGTPYERGIAHLKRAEYPEAVAAFTEAIELDPEGPNAYVGRALAHRSLDDDAAALRDEEAARTLGGPEGSTWDRIVRQAHRRWQGDLRSFAWRREDPLSRNAVLLRHWTWQIYNGGLPQWVANGFGEWADDLAQAADEVGTDASRAVGAIVRDVAAILHARPDARETMFRMIANRSLLTGRDDELFRALSRCEQSYDWARMAFVTDVEQWVDRQAGLASSPG